MSWFDNKNKIRLYRVFMVISMLLCILSLLHVLSAYAYFNGLKKLTAPIMPLIFGYFVYMYYTKIKALKK